MTERERDLLRNERETQLKNGLNQKAAMARRIEEVFGEPGLKALREGLEQDLKAWVDSVVEQHMAQGIPRDADGMHRFLWEPNQEENIEFHCKGKGNHRKYTVTRCPLAEYSRKKGIERWGAFFFCRTYPYITHIYNPDMKFTMESCLMEGDRECRFSYGLH